MNELDLHQELVESAWQQRSALEHGTSSDANDAVQGCGERLRQRVRNCRRSVEDGKRGISKPVAKSKLSTAAIPKIREDMRFGRHLLEDQNSRSTTPLNEPHYSTQSFLPLGLYPAPVNSGYRDERSDSMGAESPQATPRIGRARLGNFAKPTAAYLNRIGQMSTGRDDSSTTTPSRKTMGNVKGGDKFTQKSRARLREVGQQTGDFGTTNSPRPSVGRPGANNWEAQRRDSGNDHGSRRTSKQRLLVFSRASLGE